MATSQNSRETIQQVYFAVVTLAFALFFYLITPFRLFYYWKIPLLEDNITTLIWILPVLAFFPLYQFFRESIPKNLMKILFLILSLLYIGEIFADGYVGILLIFEGFIISLLLICGMKILFNFYNQSSRLYRSSFIFSFLMAGLGALLLAQNPIFYQIIFAIAALMAFCLSFFTTFGMEMAPRTEGKSDGWTRKSHLCLWGFIVATIALVIFMIIGIARMNLLVYPGILREFDIYLISAMAILFSAALFIEVSDYLAKKINGKVLIGLGLIILAFCYLLFSLIPNIIIYYMIVILAGFGFILFFRNLISFIFKIIQEHGRSLIFCLAISIYFDQLLMALLTLHGGNSIFIMGLITVVEILALIGVALIILSGVTFVKKKVNVKFILNQIGKVFSIFILMGIFLLAYSSSLFFNISAEEYRVANQPPIMKIENTNFQEMYEKLYSKLQSNLKIIPDSGHIFAIPGGDFYHKAVLWDTAFIAQIWKYYNITISEKILENYINQIHPNGLIPNQYYPLGSYDTLTQCPILTWACLETYEVSGNKDFLETVYPKLKRYNEWWLTTRDFDGDGLYSWIHRDETGLDDCPRFDLYPMYQINALDLNCYLVLQMRSLARISLILNNTADATYYEIKANQLANRIQTRLWDSTTGFFYDKVGANFIMIKTSAQFIPLFTEVATIEQANILLTHLNDPVEFNTTYPVPSVAKNEPSYSNMMWRGPTWINLNYLIVRGLINYNFTTEASKIAYKTIKMAEGVFNETGTFWEFYNSETGRIDDVQGKTGWVPASNYVGWDGLLANSLIENLIGVSFNGSTIPFHPIIPMEWNSSRIEIQLNQISMNLTLFNTQINSSIHFAIPSFNNVTIFDLQAKTNYTFFSPDINYLFTNFDPYKFIIK